MTQSASILHHLQERGSITPMQALNDYGCFRLAARINDLRNAGHVIHTEHVLNSGRTYARYWMDLP